MIMILLVPKKSSYACSSMLCALPRTVICTSIASSMSVKLVQPTLRIVAGSNLKLPSKTDSCAHEHAEHLYSDYSKV